MTLLRSPASRRLAALALGGALGAVIQTTAMAQTAEPPPATTVAAPVAPPPVTPSPLEKALAPVPGGLTPDEAAEAAASTSASVRSKQADLEAAQAKVDQAFIGYFPRLTLTATYMRLSEVNNSLGGGGALVGAATPGAVRTAPCPDNPAATCVVDSAGIPVQASSSSFDFPSPLNSYSLVASLLVPVSDYVLRTSQSYAIAAHSAKAEELNASAQALQTATDAKVAYYNWVRARGQVVIAEEAVAQTKAHVSDAREIFNVGLISRADVLRLEAQEAAAEQALAEATAFHAVAEQQLRTLLHRFDDKPLAIGVDVLHGAPPAAVAPLSALTSEAFEKRLEVRALDETVYSLKEAESLSTASYLPRLDAFADATYANPNQRVFPSQEQFDFTWDVGLRLSWTLNDALVARGASAEAKARTASVVARKEALRDGLRVEVATAYADLSKANASIAAAERAVVSAEESLRVRRELFRAGKATSVDIIDAEAERTRARLSQIDAHVGQHSAEARLAHATGRDVRTSP